MGLCINDPDQLKAFFRSLGPPTGLPEQRNDCRAIFDAIEYALVCAGYRLLDGDADTLIIRDSSKDQDYRIKIEMFD